MSYDQAENVIITAPGSAFWMRGSDFLDTQLLPGYRPLGLNSIQACIRIDFGQDQFNLPDYHDDSWAKECDVMDHSDKLKSSIDLHAPDPWGRANGLEQKSGMDEKTKSYFKMRSAAERDQRDMTARLMLF